MQKFKVFWINIGSKKINEKIVEFPNNEASGNAIVRAAGLCGANLAGYRYERVLNDKV